MQPFLKWPGGKRWLAPALAPLIQRNLHGTYYEPFLGGAAVYFHLLPNQSVLSDINAELVGTYLEVRDSVQDVLAALSAMPVSRDDYYRIRDWSPASVVLAAARFLYLNRTAWGGMYRVNAEGRFNVPFGGGERTPDLLWRRGILRQASEALGSADIHAMDFEEAVDEASDGDVVYCDPTYTVAHESNAFARYNERNFSWSDQIRLAAACRRAQERGAYVVVSNAYHASLDPLYPTARKHIVERKSLVSRLPSGRRSVREYLMILAPSQDTAPEADDLRDLAALLSPDLAPARQRQ